MLLQPETDELGPLNARFGFAPAQEILKFALKRYKGRIALVSSFGAEAAVLLHMLSLIDPKVPVIMLDTLLLFPETLAFKNASPHILG